MLVNSILPPSGSRPRSSWTTLPASRCSPRSASRRSRAARSFRRSAASCHTLVCSVQWDNVWKSLGGIMLNGFPREVPRPKPEGPQAPRVSGSVNSRGTQFTMIPQRLFHISSFFCHPGLVERDFFKPMESLGTIVVNVCVTKY